jgi:hypothetical protein
MRTIIADLIPASGYQNATTSPSACHAFVLRTTSVHRILRPTSVTIAIRPSWWARDARDSAGDLGTGSIAESCGKVTRRANHLAAAKCCQANFLVSRRRCRALLAMRSIIGCAAFVGLGPTIARVGPDQRRITPVGTAHSIRGRSPRKGRRYSKKPRTNNSHQAGEWARSFLLKTPERFRGSV